MSDTLPPADEGVPQRQLYPIREACVLIGGIERSTLYSLLQRGELRSVKVGRRRLIPADEIARIAGGDSGGRR